MVSNQEICQRAVDVAAKCFASIEPVAPGDGDGVPKPSTWRIGLVISDEDRAALDKMENDIMGAIAYSIATIMRERRMVSLCEADASVEPMLEGKKIVAEARANGVVAFVTENADGKSFLSVHPRFLMLGPERQPGQTEERYEEVMRSIGADYRPPAPAKETV